MPLPGPVPTNTRVLRSQTAAAAASPSKITKPMAKPRRRRADPWQPKRKPNANPTPRRRAPPPTHYTCRICIEEQTTNQFPRWATPKRGRRYGPFDVPHTCAAHLARSPSKKHVDPVCNTCIGKSLSARLDQLGARQVGVGCSIEANCQTPWSWEYIMKYIPTGEPLEKFNMEMFDVWKQDSPQLITCISPGCDTIGLPDVTAAGYPQISCNSCSVRQCAQCLIPWHNELTCAEYKSRQIDEQMSDPEKDTLKLMQTKDGKRCPNCLLVIEKDGGCDSMYCLGCRKYFNWQAAAPAVLGAKKPEPWIQNNLWFNPGSAVCEMDAMQNATATPVVPAAT
ncbi:hypothetical protein EK21DRAFT_57213 [Setomelanomma holmii]|uniref:RBR-type E3 ubiquitin transferase n=1 Tax=Setomelanomma holmii TaxID=210430 RepID=A0A9P4HH70_9PLEO|nr:hypothetical protein EK21DRAFT_57213 [Setomelanomma holmii]